MIAFAPNGDIFVSDGHAPNKYDTGRVVKFSKDGHFIKSWGRKGSAPGEFDEPHDIFVGGSRGWVYVADRKNNRIQVFDQEGITVPPLGTSFTQEEWLRVVKRLTKGTQKGTAFSINPMAAATQVWSCVMVSAGGRFFDEHAHGASRQRLLRARRRQPAARGRSSAGPLASGRSGERRPFYACGNPFVANRSIEGE